MLRAPNHRTRNLMERLLEQVLETRKTGLTKFRWSKAVLSKASQRELALSLSVLLAGFKVLYCSSRFL